MASTIDSGGGGSAASTTFAPNGDIGATDVQAAIVEVRDDTDGKLGAKADTTALAAHTSATTNPHATSIANLGAGTLAQLNAVLTGATLDEAGTARPPTTHASDHVGGSDPIPNATAGTAGLMPAADKSKLDGYPATPAGFETTSSKGVAGGYASLDVGGKIPVAQIPAVALPTVSVVADATARLALTVEEGDEAVQTDDGSHWIYDGTTWIQRATAGTGDVIGPAGATADELAVFDGLTGKVLKAGSGVSAASGNITLTGTVDGRDVAADGAKLDGIESGADVTDAANVAAAGALMTTGGTMAGPLAMGGNAITTSSTVDGRDVSADGGVLDAHVAASNPHAGSLSTSHEGAGGTVHAVAVASGAAGFISGADQAKLNGIESGATADQTAGDVPFTPVGSVSATDVQAAIAEVDGDVTAVASAAAAAQADATTALADAATAQATADAKAAIAGQLGGTAASPDVRGLRETGGPTLLALGAVADGEYLVRSGTTIVGGTPAGGGGGAPSIPALSGFTTANRYSPASGSGQLSALGADMSVLWVFAPDVDGSGFARRHVGGTRNAAPGSASGGGMSLTVSYGQIYGLGYSLVDGGGAEIQADLSLNGLSGSGIVTLLQQKWLMVSAVKSGGSLEFRANLSLLDAVFPNSGALTAGGVFTIGATDNGSVENGLDNGWIHAVAYVNRALSEAELRAIYRALVEGGQMPDISGGWTAGYRAGASDPGATWVPFSGAGDLTETGSVVFEGDISNPQWR